MRVYKCDRCGKCVALGMIGCFVSNLTTLWRFRFKKQLYDDCVRRFRQRFTDVR